MHQFKLSGRGKAGGYISVYISLVILIILGFALSMLGMAKQNVYRKLAYDKTALGSDSMLSDYCIPLSKYGIYAVDGGYETKNLSISTLEKNAAEMIEGNSEIFSERNGMPHLTEYTVRSAEMLITGNLEEFEKEIVNYTEFHLGISAAKEFVLDITGIEAALDDKDVFVSDLEAAVNNDEQEDSGESDYSEEEADFDPREEANKLLKMGVLNAALPSGFKVSGKKLNYDCCIDASKEKIVDIISDFKSEENVKSVLSDFKGFLGSAVNMVLVDEYALAMFGNAISKKENRAIQYETEMILCGEDSDIDNLKSTLKRLLMLRTVMNLSHILTDPEKKAEAHAMAASITFLVPFMEEVVYYLIISAWAYAEANMDARLLLSGKKVPLIKSRKDWVLSLSNFGMTTETISDKYGKSGMDYKSYLRILLLGVSKNNKLKRIAKLVESNVRMEEGYENFCISNCIVGFSCMAVFDVNGINDYEVNYRTHY